MPLYTGQSQVRHSALEPYALQGSPQWHTKSTGQRCLLYMHVVCTLTHSTHHVLCSTPCSTHQLPKFSEEEKYPPPTDTPPPTGTLSKLNANGSVHKYTDTHTNLTGGHVSTHRASLRYEHTLVPIDAKMLKQLASCAESSIEYDDPLRILSILN
jgi:hypothetical protein